MRNKFHFCLVLLVFVNLSTSNGQTHFDNFIRNYGTQLDSSIKYYYKSELNDDVVNQRMLSNYKTLFDSVTLTSLKPDSLLKYGTSYIRQLVLSRANTWTLIKPRPNEICYSIIILILSVVAMAFGGFTKRKGEIKTLQDLGVRKDKYTLREFLNKNNYFINRHFHQKKQRSLLGLFQRDFGPLSFDVSTHGDRAEISEYRGLLHWFRDVIEKFISVMLIFVFIIYISKILGYIFDFMEGNVWRLVLIPLEINIIISIVGLSLIVDGLIIVSSMTDAPGIGRVLDAVIIVLAGVIVMFVQAEPGEISLVTFSLGPQPTIPLFIAFAIGFLFIIRWIVRHHTIAELKGHI